MKKFIAMLVVALMFTTTIFTPVFAEGEGENPTVEYEVSDNDDGTVTIIGFYNLYDYDDVVIPSEIDGKTVTHIGSYAFAEYLNSTEKPIKTVTIPDTVVEIGINSFETCQKLEEVIISENAKLKKIEEGAFKTCEKLKKIEIPNTVEEIGASAFGFCSGLEEISIPNSVKTMGYFVFDECVSLKTIKLSENVEKLDVGLFEECISLESIKIPESVTSISDKVFFGCTSLKTINIPKNVKEIGIHDDPEYFEEYGADTFVGCTSLEEILVAPENMYYESAGGVLYDEYKTMLISYPADKKDESYVVEDSTVSIMGNSFNGVTHIKNVTVPETLNKIGKYAFMGASSLKAINITDSITELGDEAFSGCISLETANIPAGLEEIPFGLFFECENMSSVKIPDGIKNIGPYAFGSCKKLSEVVIPDGVKTIGYGAFGNCSNLTSVNIPTSVDRIEDSAFAAANLTKVTIPGHLHYLGDSTFAWNYNLSQANFMGDAPEQWAGFNIFHDATPDFTIHYQSGTKGWESPKYHNYKSVAISGNIPDVDNNGGSTTVPEVPDKVEENDGKVIVEIKPEISGDLAVATLTKETVENIIKESESSTFEIKIDAAAGTKRIETDLEKGVLSAILEKCDNLILTTANASISFDKKSLQSILGNAAENVKISVNIIDAKTLDEKAQEKIAGRPVLEFSITSAGKNISDFGKGSKINVSIPYTLNSGEKPNKTVIYYINDQKIEIVKSCKYDSDTNEMKFATDHFSTYAVGYENNEFDDVNTSDWFADGVDFVTSRELFKGYENNKFAPLDSMTRGMLVTILGRLDNADVEGKAADFADVDNSKYYAPYIAWAYELGIVNGTGDNNFAPDKVVTREEIAVVLANYAQYIGIELSSEEIDFADGEQISSWAKDAVSKIQTINIFSGKPGNMFDPKADSNRAEVSVLLMRFIDFLVK